MLMKTLSRRKVLNDEMKARKKNVTIQESVLPTLSQTVTTIS